MIILTGALGFIGSNILEGLNKAGIDRILLVDDFSDGKRMDNLEKLNFLDFMDKDDFLGHIKKIRSSVRSHIYCIKVLAQPQLSGTASIL